MAPSKQNTVLITGCSAGGIGDALAQEFHRRGLRVFATARSLSKIAHLKELDIHVLELDVTSPKSISNAVSTVSAATSGTLDILVNNSGGGYAMPVLDFDIAVSKALFDVNFFGVVSITQAFIPLLVQAKGMIVSNKSFVAVLPIPFQGIYNASKAAASILTSNMRLELAPLGVRVVDLRTGLINTKFFDNLSGAGALPAGSLYMPAKTEIENSMAGELAKPKMDAEVFAKKVVNDVLRSSPSSVSWRGGLSTTAWFVTQFMPEIMGDMVLTRGLGLEKISAKYV